MKKLILLSMVFFCAFGYGQRNDTIFFKSGKFITVYKVIGNYLGTVSYVLDKGESEQQVDTIKVKCFTSSNSANGKFYTTANISEDDKINIESKYFESNKGKLEIDYKTGWIQYNLGEYYKEERTSQVFYGLSFVSGIVYATNPLKNSVFMYITGGLGLVGFVIHIDSYKWMKRASIETSLSGVSLKVKL